MASLVFSSNLGNEEMPIEEYVQLGGDEMHSASWLSYFIWHGVDKSIWV